MVDDTVPCFGFPTVGRKKVTAAFDDGRLTSDGGVMLLALAERRLGIAERLARLIPDRRNQMRLVLHTAAYWLMLDVRDAIPKIRDLASAEFTTLRLCLLKVAARIVEARHRVRIAFAAACPEADVIAGLSAALIRRRI